MVEFQSKLQKFDSDLWGHHFPVAPAVAEKFTSTNGRRVIATIGEERFHCALMPLASKEWFININKQIRDKLGLTQGDEATIILEPDLSTYGLPVSEEFEEVLRQDPEAGERFESLTPGLRRTLIYYADNVKSSQIKVRRAIVVMEHLKMHNGKVDFKVLNEEMKAANRAHKLR